MKITAIHSRAVSVPVRFPIVSCVRQTDHVIFVLVDVMTDEGLAGISYIQAFNVHGARAIMNCIAHLESVIIGRDALETDELWQCMRQAIKLLGIGGLPMFALSAVDIALWDIKGKVADVPVCQLLGDAPGTFEAYQSDGMWLVSPEEAARQASLFAQEGFGAMKMRLGRQTQRDDIKAAGEVRKIIGDQIELMGDVNQGWTYENAIRMVRQLADYNLAWLEEPVDAEDVENHARLQSATSIPLATGENLYGNRSLQQFLQQQAVAIYTLDLQRCGGITGWLDANRLLGKYKMSAGLHLFPEYAVHLFPLIERPVKLEWMSWAGILFAEPVTCKKGWVNTPHRAGFVMPCYLTSY